MINQNVIRGIVAQYASKKVTHMISVIFLMRLLMWCPRSHGPRRFWETQRQPLIQPWILVSDQLVPQVWLCYKGTWIILTALLMLQEKLVGPLFKSPQRFPPLPGTRRPKTQDIPTLNLLAVAVTTHLILVLTPHRASTWPNNQKTIIGRKWRWGGRRWEKELARWVNTISLAHPSIKSFFFPFFKTLFFSLKLVQ